MLPAVPHPSSLFLCSLVEKPHSRRTMVPSGQEPGQFEEQAATSKPRMVTSWTSGTATAKHKYLNQRPGFWKGKQKLLVEYRPPQTGPRNNMATVAEVKLLTAAKCKGEACQTTLRPGLLPYTSSSLQHFLHHGGGSAAHPGFCPSCMKTSWELHYKPDNL